MSKTDEIRNRFHSSIDAPSSVRQRSGESEDGEALGELLSDNSRSALEELEEREERPERVRFLKQFFALLKQTLTPEEFKFIKLRYTKKKTDRQIAVWLGFKSTGIQEHTREAAPGGADTQSIGRAERMGRRESVCKSHYGERKRAFARYDVIAFRSAERKRICGVYESAGDSVGASTNVRKVSDAPEIFHAWSLLRHEDKRLGRRIIP
mgnify:CR=1 FL=1